MGDGYGWCVTVRRDADRALLKGAMRAPTPSEYRAIRRALLAEGFKEAVWERQGGRTVRVRPNP